MENGGGERGRLTGAEKRGNLLLFIRGESKDPPITRESEVSGLAREKKPFPSRKITTAAEQIWGNNDSFREARARIIICVVRTLYCGSPIIVGPLLEWGGWVRRQYYLFFSSCKSGSQLSSTLVVWLRVGDNRDFATAVCPRKVTHIDFLNKTVLFENIQNTDINLFSSAVSASNVQKNPTVPRYPRTEEESGTHIQLFFLSPPLLLRQSSV